MVLTIVIALVGVLLTATLVLLLLRRAGVIRAGAVPQAVPAATPQAQGDHPARQYPLRRPAMPTRTAFLLCLAFLADIVVVGGVTAYFQYQNVRLAQLLQREGVKARAQVVALEVAEDSEGYDSYYVTYTFVSQPEGAARREITRQDSVPYELYQQLEEGSRIEVIYARSEPEVARLMADYRPGSFDVVPGAVGAVSALVSLGGLLWFLPRYRRGARLDEAGVTAMVEVLDMYEASSGESISYYIAYQLPGDVPFRQAVSASLYRQLQVGGQVAVRYLPDDPGVFRVQVE